MIKKGTEWGKERAQNDKKGHRMRKRKSTEWGKERAQNEEKKKHRMIKRAQNEERKSTEW